MYNRAARAGRAASRRPKPSFAAPDSSAPTRQGIKRTSPKNAGEKARRSPDAVLARPLSLPSYPVATGRPLPGHQRPRALRVRKGVKAGDRKSLNLNPGDPSRSSSIAPAETILRRARYFGTHAPRDKENQPEKCRRESTPEPPMLFWRDPSRCYGVARQREGSRQNS